MSARPVAIVGGGIAGLTLALCLHAKGVAARVHEKAAEIRPLGVGINVLPHATRVLHALGLGDALARAAIATGEAAFFNRFGQLIYAEPLGRDAGYATPQWSIHRADLLEILLAAWRERAGDDALVLDATCTGFERTGPCVRLAFARTGTGEALHVVEADAAVACDGIHSAIRRQLHPDEGPPRYSGVLMWRGAVRWPSFLSGATMVRAGWLTTGKMVIYPIRGADASGRQLVNWVAEIERPLDRGPRDWNRPGRLEDFLPAFADWHFDWLDVPAMISATQTILEFPMVDQDPLPFWRSGRVTLMGDAAHPMVPRGSNGAGQAILDAECLAGLLAGGGDPAIAFAAYERERLEATSRVVLMNRVAPPDIVIKEVRDRTGDRPFARIEDVISRDELAAFQRRYREIAGHDLATLRAKAGGG